jgi:hypothetical protein
MEPHTIDMLVSGFDDARIAALVHSVLERLPDSWDLYRTFDFELSDLKPDVGYASCLREEEAESGPLPGMPEGHHEQCWTVTLYRPWLAVFSDEASRWIIAHELGHVASGIACGSLVFGGRPYTRMSGTTDQYREVTPEEKQGGEKIADAIARAWGFWLEEEAFASEAQGLKESGSVG